MQGDFFAGSEATFYWSDPPAGQLEGHIVTTTSADALDEADGWVTVTLLPEDEYTIGRPKTATVTILDDDDVPGAIGDLAAAPGDERVVLSWSPPMDEGTSPVLGFDYRARKETAKQLVELDGHGCRSGREQSRLHGHEPRQRHAVHVRGPGEERGGQRPALEPGHRHTAAPAGAHLDRAHLRRGQRRHLRHRRRHRRDGDVRPDAPISTRDNGTPSLTLTIGNGTGEAACALATDTKEARLHLHRGRRRRGHRRRLHRRKTARAQRRAHPRDPRGDGRRRGPDARGARERRQPQGRRREADARQTQA